MRYLKATLMLVAVLQVTALMAQAPEIQKLSPKKALKQADYLYSIGSYYNAAQYYENVYEKQSDNAYVVSQIADCENRMRDYKEGEKWYKTLLDLNSPDYPQAQYNYALMLKYNGKYDAAKNTFNSVAKNYKGTDASKIKKAAKLQSSGCDLAMQLMQKPDTTAKIIHLGANVNAPYTEFAPLPMGDTALMFASLKSDKIMQLDEMKQENKVAMFYTSKKVGDDYQLAKPFSAAPFNSANVHTGNGAFSPDKKHFYFTRCKLDNTLKVTCEIYMSKYENGRWSDPAKLPDAINDGASNNTEPTVGTSKAGEILYWCSDRANGEGGMDIWYSTLDKDGNWSAAKNAGRKINTEGNEMTPFADSKNNMFYFSSDGLEGMGGFDVFKAKGSVSKFEDPVNMGVPVNSSVDDLYYILDDKRFTAYLVSNRPGTISVKSETCCDDIWRVQYPKIIYYAVRGNVYDEDTKQIIPDAKVMLVDDKELMQGQANSAPDKLYFFDTKPKTTYAIKSTKDGYFTGSANFTVYTKEESDTQRVDVYMKKIPKGAIRIKNIYYDFDKATLRPESTPALDSLYHILVDNPAIIVEIGSHTDSKGNDNYNMKLSQARAQSVVDFLKTKGIPIERMQAKGYGETMPVAPNTLPDGKDNPEGRQENRRTEFKIIGTIPNVDLIYEKGDTGFDQNAVDTYEEQHGEQPKDDQPKDNPKF